MQTGNQTQGKEAKEQGGKGDTEKTKPKEEKKKTKEPKEQGGKAVPEKPQCKDEKQKSGDQKK